MENVLPFSTLYSRPKYIYIYITSLGNSWNNARTRALHTPTVHAYDVSKQTPREKSISAISFGN